MTFQSSGASHRALSLDAFRGYAILTMVLSGAIVYGILPGWMYHAQVPPPAHKFDPSIFGITWVDLVFPFFLFAMGAAFPFSIRKKLSEKGGVYKAILNALITGCHLTFFAIYIQHLYPSIISEPQDLRAWLVTLFTMFFTRLNWHWRT
jgi:predicted acyltransferase